MTELEQVSEQVLQDKTTGQTNSDSQQPQNADAKNYLLEHDRPNCIGCAACAAVAPEFWEMNEDGKSDIIKGKSRNDEWQELNIEEKNFELNKEAAEACPVNVIHLKDKNTGDRII